MMKKTPFFTRLFGRLFKRKLSEREAEISFRCKVAEMNRVTAALKREADKAKAEAIAFEKAGDHERAVALANIALTKQRNYEAALQVIERAITTRDTAKGQQIISELFNDCTKMMKDVIAKCNPTTLITAQTEFETLNHELVAAQEALNTSVQGFAPETNPVIVNTAGEAALKQILAESNPQPTQEVLTATPAIPAIPAAPAETARQQAEHAEWATDRRKVLAELV